MVLYRLGVIPPYPGQDHFLGDDTALRLKEKAHHVEFLRGQADVFYSAGQRAGAKVQDGIS